MRSLITVVFSFLFCPLIFGQPATEIYISELDLSDEGFQFNNAQNISNNLGYDNQPFFLDNDTLLYARNNKGQTDIAMYIVSKQETLFIHNPTEGGEYSPQPLPDNSTIASVRLDPDGMQRLYAYKSGNTDMSPLFPDLKVAYFSFINDEEILASVIRMNQLDLVRANKSTGETIDLVTNSGRCIQKIPGSKSFSYTILNEEKNFDLYQYDPEINESYFVCQLPIGVQDYVWFEDYKIIIGSGTQLFVYDLFGKGDWLPIADFKDSNLTNITRLALSQDYKRFAFVAELIKD